jgi:hypothetical protein
MQALPSPTSLVLVAVINQTRDLEIARLLGWYRIPLRKAPKIVAVDYLAFYQTGAFADQKWQIEFFAPVRGHELSLRGELLKDEMDHPRAKEEYYKIQLGPLVRLPHPILAGKWKRITFLYTTGRYLLNARSINDLVVHTDERVTLWKALRERATKEQDYIDIPEIEIDQDMLAMLLGLKSSIDKSVGKL